MKNPKKRVIILSSCLVILVLLFLFVFFLYQEPKIPVLCYHNLAIQQEKENFPEEQDWTITIENFEEQMKYLSKHGYYTLSLEEFELWKKGEKEFPRKSILITFDDGFLSNYHYAFPILKKYNMKATIFLIGDYIKNSTAQEWKGNIKEYMSLDVIQKSKEEYPNIEFASHSYGLHYHGSIKEKSKKELEQDMDLFRQNIADTKAYCYPFGKCNENMIEALKKQNYQIAFIYGPTKKEYRKASRKDDNYKIPRLNVSHGMQVWKLALRLALPY